MVQRDFDQMQEILEAYSTSDSIAEWAEYNRRFHLALGAPANNRKLKRLIEEYCLNTDRYTHEIMSLATGKDAPQAEHYRILEACRCGSSHILEMKKNFLATARMKEML